MVVPIEMKINVEGDIDEAPATLGVTPLTAVTRRIWFGDARLPVGANAPSPRADHVIVLLRIGSAGDDLTVPSRKPLAVAGRPDSWPVALMPARPPR